MIPAYPKIFTLGHRYVQDVWNEEVEITEKLDGSQFSFGKIDGEVMIRSKEARIYPENPDKMFKIGVDYVMSLDLPEDYIFYCEYMNKPHHNALTYNRVPRNNLMCFGISDKTGTDFYPDLRDLCKIIDIESAPIIFQGKVDFNIPENKDMILAFLEDQSYFGGTTIEGFVIKNYHRPFMMGSLPFPLMAAKFVSEKFKEVHGSGWKASHTGKGRWETFKERYCTEARWLKSVQHKRDAGVLDNSPKDIGMLIKAIQIDISCECQDEITKFLWEEFGPELLRGSVRGFAEWYKEYLFKSTPVRS